MAEETTRQVLPTATGFAAKEAIAVLRKHHVAIAPLLRRAGLSEHELAQAEYDGSPTSHRVSAVAQVKFLDYAAEAMNDSTFGLHVVEQADPHDAGIYFYLVSAAKDIGEALALYARYFRIVNEAARLKLTRKPNGVAVEIEFVGLPRHFAQQTAEFGMAALLKGLRVVAGRNIHPTRVSFAHMRRSGAREFERFYGCPVEFGASSDLFRVLGRLPRYSITHRRPKATQSARTILRYRGEAAQHCCGNVTRRGRERSRKIAAPRQSESADGRQSASPQPSYPLAKASR